MERPKRKREGSDFIKKGKIMSEFLNRLESVKNKAVKVTDTFIEFSKAFDDLYSYCVEAHEAKKRRQGQLLQTEEHPLLAAYKEHA